jgi:hypothetical protein
MHVVLTDVDLVFGLRAGSDYVAADRLGRFLEGLRVTRSVAFLISFSVDNADVVVWLHEGARRTTLGISAIALAAALDCPSVGPLRSPRPGACHLSRARRPIQLRAVDQTHIGH